MDSMKQYHNEDVRDSLGESTKWWFFSSMISACGPVFADCADNHEVEKRLKDARVIDELANGTDSGSITLYVDFKTRGEGHAFIRRLNRYIKKWHQDQARVEEKAAFVLEGIRDHLWPEDNPDRDWEASDLDEIANLMTHYGWGKDR